MLNPSEVARQEQELELQRRAASEWMEKWRHAESRIDAVWNLAIEAALTRVESHTPPCTGICGVCLTYKDLRRLLRLDMAGYIPVKERLRKRVEDLKLSSELPQKERRAYSRGLYDLLVYAESVLADNE